MRIAVIDLGTNTFNILLAHTQPNGKFTTIYSGKQAAKIGEGGINLNTITAEGTIRAIKVLNNFKRIITDNGGADKIAAIATSAVRSAKNRVKFVEEVKLHTGINVHIISGETEAALIYEGVMQTTNVDNETVLILDIGGGSNEFIIANQHQVFWKHSFPLGVARLLEMFKPENPITATTLEKIEQYLNNELKPLWAEVAKYSLRTLIGSSGSFETYRSILTQGEVGEALSYNIPINDYFSLHNVLLSSTIEERLKMKGMEIMRVEMIVLASIFTNFVVHKIGIQHITQSEYSLKEGVMKVLAENNRDYQF